MNAVSDGTDPPAGDALGTTEQTPDRHQGGRLVHAEPVTLHELHQANDGIEGRVDLAHLHSFPITPGQEVRLNLNVWVKFG